MTRLLKINPLHPQPEVIAEAAALIRAGKLVAFPTETVYGLGADGLSAGAVARIFAAKGRPASDPLILHLADAEAVGEVALEVPLLARRLASAFWPGPLTLVLPRRESVPSAVAAGGPTVAVRVPAHPVALALIRAVGRPIAAPSANLFSRPSPTSAADVLEDLDGRVDLVLDAGETRIGLESTVLGFSDGNPVLLRPGGLGLEAIEEVAGAVLLPGEAALPEDRAQPAPGMLLRHYSPRARLLYLADARPSRPGLGSTMRAAALRALERGERLGLLACDEALIGLEDLSAERASLGPGDDLSGVSARLFRQMRVLDRLGVSAILTHGYSDAGLGRALGDRLYRAASGQVHALEDSA